MTQLCMVCLCINKHSSWSGYWKDHGRYLLQKLFLCIYSLWMLFQSKTAYWHLQVMNTIAALKFRHYTVCVTMLYILIHVKAIHLKVPALSLKELYVAATKSHRARAEGRNDYWWSMTSISCLPKSKLSAMWFWIFSAKNCQ